MTEKPRAHGEPGQATVGRGPADDAQPDGPLSEVWAKRAPGTVGRDEEQAFTQWVEELYGPMLLTAMGYLRNREAAEEVVQETWMIALRGSHGFEGRSALRTWIFAILHNCTRERLKKERRRGELLRSGVMEGKIESDPVSAAISQNRPPSSSKTPERLFLAAEIGEVLSAALSTLPARQQEVLRMGDVLGYSSKEVCARLGLTRAAERSLRFRARSRLRQLLSPYLKGRV